eukprot:6750017-Ditylum_brightwellii.AAC.1
MKQENAFMQHLQLTGVFITGTNVTATRWEAYEWALFSHFLSSLEWRLLTKDKLEKWCWH